MAWVKFTADYDYRRPGVPVTTAYKAGMRCALTAGCREAVLKARAAVAIKTPSRADAEKLKANPYWVAG